MEMTVIFREQYSEKNPRPTTYMEILHYEEQLIEQLEEIILKEHSVQEKIE